MKTKAPLLAMLLCLLAGYSAQVSALEFWPTETEWATWPEYCRVRYTVSGAGIESKFTSRISPAEVKAWEARMGALAWNPLHHYCAGIVLIQRARALQGDKTRHDYTLNNAIGEFEYTLARMPREEPFHSQASMQMAIAYQNLGEFDTAMQFFDEAIEDHPENAESYAAKALAYKEKGKLEEARATLEQGNKAVDGTSSLIHYFLGLVLVDLHKYDEAREHARQAYALGYPLPGLRDKLASNGFPLE